MKRIICFVLAFAMLACFVDSASAVTVGDENSNIYSMNWASASYVEYYDYLKALRESRGTVYSADELTEIYNQISFYMINKKSIETSDVKLQNLINSILLVGIRTDSECNCVEVVVYDLSEKKAELFSEFICDSDAVVLWNNSQLNAPSAEYTEVEFDVKPADPTAINLKSGQTKSIPVANKDKVQLWKSSSKAVEVRDGTAIACKKGSADVTAVYSSTVEVTFHCEVTNNPALKYNGKNVSSLKIKKGKSKSLKLIGKVSSINNKYTSAKKAKIASKASAKTIVIKGLKKGSTAVKIKVNNSYTFKINVKVI